MLVVLFLISISGIEIPWQPRCSHRRAQRGTEDHGLGTEWGPFQKHLEPGTNRKRSGGCSSKLENHPVFTGQVCPGCFLIRNKSLHVIFLCRTKKQLEQVYIQYIQYDIKKSRSIVGILISGKFIFQRSKFSTGNSCNPRSLCAVWSFNVNLGVGSQLRSLAGQRSNTKDTYIERDGRKQEL